MKFGLKTTETITTDSSNKRVVDCMDAALAAQRQKTPWPPATDPTPMPSQPILATRQRKELPSKKPPQLQQQQGAAAALRASVIIHYETANYEHMVVKAVNSGNCMNSEDHNL